jgi:hypothetical protein
MFRTIHLLETVTYMPMLPLVVRHSERKCKTLTRNTCVVSKSFVSIVFKVLYGYTSGFSFASSVAKVSSSTLISCAIWKAYTTT